MKHRITAALFWMGIVTLLLGTGCQKPEGPGWYKGDLHCHSTHSDGDSPVKDVIASAEFRGLDFFVITDHDGNMSGSPSQWYDPDYHSDKMIMLYGVEWTTGQGHANVWASNPFDYEALWQANRARDAQAGIDAAHEQGALFSINHPSAYPCCVWEYENLVGFDSIEVWNALYRIPNYNFISTHIFWDEHLLAGRRVTGLGGSDTHQLKGLVSFYLKLGEPTTWVYAEQASAEAVLSGIKAGRVSISDEPGGVRLDFTADTDGDGIMDAMMGDNIMLQEETDVVFQIQIEKQRNALKRRFRTREVTAFFENSSNSGADTLDNLVSSLEEEDAYVALILKNGSFHGAWKILGDSGTMEFSDRVSSDEPVFYRIELFGKPPEGPINRLLRGRMKAMSNPIYFGFAD